MKMPFLLQICHMSARVGAEFRVQNDCCFSPCMGNNFCKPQSAASGRSFCKNCLASNTPWQGTFIWGGTGPFYIVGLILRTFAPLVPVCLCTFLVVVCLVFFPRLGRQACAVAWLWPSGRGAFGPGDEYSKRSSPARHRGRAGS